VRQYTAQEVTDAIAVRGHLEGMAARLVAEHGVSRQLQGDLQACLDAGDEALLTTTRSPTKATLPTQP
jgi:GntR family transcriptional regulator of vanillate catabolism